MCFKYRFCEYLRVECVLVSAETLVTNQSTQLIANGYGKVFVYHKTKARASSNHNVLNTKFLGLIAKLTYQANNSNENDLTESLLAKFFAYI